MAIIIDFKARKAKKNRKNLIDRMVKYFQTVMPEETECLQVAFAIASLEDRKNCGGLDDFNNLKPIA